MGWSRCYLIIHFIWCFMFWVDEIKEIPNGKLIEEEIEESLWWTIKLETKICKHTVAVVHTSYITQLKTMIFKQNEQQS